MKNRLTKIIAICLLSALLSTLIFGSLSFSAETLTVTSEWQDIIYPSELYTTEADDAAYKVLYNFFTPLLEEHPDGILLRRIGTTNGETVERCIAVKSVRGNLRAFDVDMYAADTVGRRNNIPLYSYFKTYNSMDFWYFTQISLNDGRKGYERFYDLSVNEDLRSAETITEECYELLFYLRNDTSYFLTEHTSETPDYEIDGVAYYKVDEKWQGYVSFKRKLTNVMTDELAEATLEYSAIDINGHLYLRKITSSKTYNRYQVNLRLAEKDDNTVRFFQVTEDEGYQESAYVVTIKVDDTYKVAYYEDLNLPWNSDYEFSEEYLSYIEDDKDEEARILAAQTPAPVPEIPLIPDTSDSTPFYFILAVVPLTACVALMIVKKKTLVK